MSNSNYNSYTSFSKSIFNLEKSVKESSNLYNCDSSSNNQIDIKYNNYSKICSDDNVFHCDIKTYKNLVRDFSK